VASREPESPGGAPVASMIHGAPRRVRIDVGAGSEEFRLWVYPSSPPYAPRCQPAI
jgi:hypothetical protein